MKRSFYIIASLLLLAGCSDTLSVEGQLIPDGEMAVNLKLEGPMAGPGTRSYVSGQETAVSTIEMLCFDTEGAFITSREGTVAATDATHGTLTGSVPANTARIHFIANFVGLNLSSFGVGTLERTMMKSPALASGINDNVRFWGYHKEVSPSAMASYLSSGSNKIILLRDRAKVTVINNDNDIETLQWTISNGLSKGFVAAASSSDTSNPYDNNYETSTILTEYRSSGVYTLAESDPNIWTGPGADSPQFLFENANSTDPVKIIIKASFKDGTERYHTILLQDNDKKLYRIFRNQSFVLTIQDLPSVNTTTAIGSSDFATAVSTTNYSNNPFAQVAREVNEVNDDEYRLTIDTVTQLYHSGSTGTINFTYTKIDGSGTSFSASDFEASWEPKEDTDESPNVSPITTNPTVNYVASTGKGTITFTLETITSDFKHNTLQIVSPSGLTRYVDVSSITKFNFTTAPALVDNGTERTVGGLARETYKLTFTLQDNIPASAYPLTVKMYTGTLIPFSDNTPTAPHNSFNIAVGLTNDLDASDYSNQWNYNANKWDSWYEYVINEPSSDNSYLIYLNEFVKEKFPEVIQSTVGLYFEIEHFGDRISLSAPAPQPSYMTETFSPGDFSIGNNHSDSESKNGVTVALSNCASGNSSYFVAGYDSGFIITTRHNGTIRVTSEEDAIITKIEITYVSGYTGGNVSFTTGNFEKSGTTGTWTGDTNDVTLTLQRTNNNVYARVASIKVTYLSY